MASPAAVLRLRVLLLKAAYVGAADLLGEWRKTQVGALRGVRGVGCRYQPKLNQIQCNRARGVGRGWGWGYGRQGSR